MKKNVLTKFCFLFFIVIVLFLTGCPVKQEPEEPKGFWANNTIDDSYYRVPSTKLYEGLNCIVYVEDANLNKCNAATAQSIANEFDNNINTKIITKFGTNPDVDNNNKIIILILDIKDGYSGSGGYVAGFFDPRQEYSNQSLKNAGYPENSNEMDIIYMDCYPTTVASPSFYQTAAHEFQHMINFNQKAFVQHSSSAQDTWMNEGLSSAAETIYSGNIVSWKVNYYNGAGYDNSSIKNGENFLYWKSDGANYSTVYLFFQWLRAQSSNGDDIYKEIINQTNNDYNDVLNRAKVRFTSYSSATWQTMIRDWFIANLFNTSGIYGYGSLAISTVPTIASSGTYNLFPGDGLYIGISSPALMTPGGTIDYAGLNKPTIDIDPDPSGGYSGNVLLAFNYDGVVTSGSTSVTLSGVSTSTNLVLKSYNYMTSTKSYPIDAVIKPVFLNKE